jgi:uncharacterized protein (TIGR02270 family)
MMADILEQHLDEIALLWEIRRGALRSAAFVPRQVRELERRIELHVRGLVYGQPLDMLREHLGGEDPAQVFAAAYALLRLEDAGAPIVLEAFPRAQAGMLDGLREALCHGGNGKTLRTLPPLASSASAAVQVARLEVLAFHSRLGPETGRLEGFVASEDPEVRQAAWRINGQAGCVNQQQFFEAAFGDQDPRVRREALWSAGWTQQKWLLGHCRTVCANPMQQNCDALLLLGVLGQADDLQRIQSLGKPTELGAKRFQILGAYGHPRVVEELIAGINSPDVRAAVAAGAAFAKITGCDIESDQRVQLPPEDGHDPDEFEKEFLDEAKLPDAQRARAHWLKVQGQFAKGTRWCRGFDLSQGTKPEILDQLDMESRWEACLRGKFEGTWRGNPIDLERFPQPKPASQGQPGNQVR